MHEQPKYQVVIDWIKNGIEEGTLHYGDKLPSEKSLSEKFGLSRQTIRHATGELEKENLLTRVQGSGTYIGSARPLARREKYHNIVVLSTFYESYIFPQILKGIAGTLEKAGYTTQVSFTENRLDTEERILKNLLEKDNFDGVIVEPTQSALPNPNITYYRQIRERQIPVITFNTFYRDLKVPCVRIDDEKIADHATQLLIDNGHTKIAGMFKLDDGQGGLRYLGYLDAMRRNHLSTDQDHILWYDAKDLADIKDLAGYYFQRIKGCTALVCYNDQAAMTMIEAAERQGLSVPDDLSVTGMDDSDLASICRVPITSFPHPKEELGKKAAENLLRMIEDPQYDGSYLYDASPVLRKSVKDIR